MTKSRHKIRMFTIILDDEEVFSQGGYHARHAAREASKQIYRTEPDRGGLYPEQVKTYNITTVDQESGDRQTFEVQARITFTLEHKEK